MQSDAVPPQATDVSLRADALVDMHELAPYPDRPWLATVSTSESHVRLTWKTVTRAATR